MSSFPRPCTICGARAVPGTNRCPRHPGVVMPESVRLERFPYRRHYGSEEYRRNRALAYRRSGGYCENPDCRVRLGPDWACDHILPLRDGGSDELTNLQCLCRACTLAKTRADRARRHMEGVS